MARAIAVSALVAALALVAAGCGGGGNDSSSSVDPTEAWASDFCDAVTTWKTDLENTTSQLSDASNLSQGTVRTAANDMQDSTQTLVNTLQNLGKPPTDSGQQVQDSINSLSTTLDEQSKTIKDAAQGMTSFTRLPSAIATISTSLSSMAMAFSYTVQTMQDADVNAEIKTAFDNSPNCAAFRSS